MDGENGLVYGSISLPSKTNQVKKRPLKYSVSVEDIAHNTTGQAQYAGSVAPYQLPSTNPHLYKVGRYQTQWSKENTKSRMTYVDKIFLNAKKPERVVPAPTAYSADRTKHMMHSEVN
jgi:hypothetical protein